MESDGFAYLIFKESIQNAGLPWGSQKLNDNNKKDKKLYYQDMYEQSWDAL